MKSLRVYVAIVVCVFCLLGGLGGGWYGAYQKYVVSPAKAAQETAVQQQAELEKMKRHGKAIAVEPDTLTVKVEKGVSDVGKTISVGTSEYTAVQVGMNFVNRPGEKTDLTKWFKAGDNVDLMVTNGQVVALHREFRPEEQTQQPGTIGS